MRIMCHFSRDSNLQSLFTNQRSDECMDVYKLMAKYAFKLVDVNDCTDDQRSNCKIVVLGLCYGLGAKEMAKNLRKSVDEATTLKKIFFSAFPGIRTFFSHPVISIFEFCLLDWHSILCVFINPLHQRFAYTCNNNTINNCSTYTKSQVNLLLIRKRAPLRRAL